MPHIFIEDTAASFGIEMSFVFDILIYLPIQYDHDLIKVMFMKNDGIGLVPL